MSAKARGSTPSVPSARPPGTLPAEAGGPSGMADIPLLRETRGGGYARAVLSELYSRLLALLERGEEGAVDLRSLPMGPGDYSVLKRLLGDGEVQATVEAMGPSRVRETAMSGVWWVTHRDADGQVVAERLEVTRVPEILVTHPADLEAALPELEALIEDGGKEVSQGG